MPAEPPFPNRPLTILISAREEGPSDNIARFLAPRMAARLGQEVRVEGIRPMHACFAQLARDPADGYRIGIAAGGFFIMPGLYRDAGFDPGRDFAAVTLVASVANVLVVPAAAPVGTLADLIELARARPGQLKYGTSGFATPPHLAGELLGQMTGTQMVPVAFKGHAAAGAALAAGEVDFMFDAIKSATKRIASGEARAIAVTPRRRFPVLPEVPTIAECGLPDYEINPDIGVVAPVGTPPDRVELLSATINAIVHSDEGRRQFTDWGMEAVGTTPQDFSAYMGTAFDRWARVLRNAGIAKRDRPTGDED